MLYRTLPRACAALIFIAIVAVLFHSDATRYHNMGREGFLAHEAGRFDRHYADTSTDLVTEVLGVPILVGVFLMAYEALAYGLSRLLFAPSSKTDPP